ncbi:MAG: RNA polymerase sigma factor [Ignavibacteriales bacterium]|nr:RNA polymerase sigma factor [Ignavibacteriales bacterium]
MAHVRDGNVTMLGELFERYSDKLFGFFVRYTNRRDASEDLVQEVFLRILKYRQTFRGEAPFAAWMYQLARNAANDHFKKSKKEFSIDELSEQNEPRNTMDDILHGQEQSSNLQIALSKIAPDKREVLILSRFQDMKYEEIGEILACPVGTIKARVHYALKDLREEYFKLTGERTK